MNPLILMDIIPNHVDYYSYDLIDIIEPTKIEIEGDYIFLYKNDSSQDYVLFSDYRLKYNKEHGVIYDTALSIGFGACYICCWSDDLTTALSVVLEDSGEEIDIRTGLYLLQNGPYTTLDNLNTLLYV